MEIKFYNSDLEDFLNELEKSALAKALRTLDLLEKYGNRLGMPHSKKVGDNLFELRVRGKSEIRIIYAFRKNKIIILLHAFIKKSQKISKRDIRLSYIRLNSLESI